MRYLVAVSGGVDSVVLLDMLDRLGGHELIVAHFDHGIRSDSAADARFVGELAKKYDAMFVSKREELGSEASEELARVRRYAFLHDQAQKYQARIVTAHHADDVIETISINLTRGTGWRGSAILDGGAIHRPLLQLTKDTLHGYAATRRLEWVEDSTNKGTKYLRNRVRRRLGAGLAKEQKQSVLDIWKRQVDLKRHIDEETIRYLTPSHTYSRYLFIHTDDLSASELFRAAVFAKIGASPTRPQIERGLLAIKTAQPGTTLELGSGIRLHFTMRTFIVEAI